jgi:protein tyrosine phosphatase (PTP) superfamily phosphohydrolase (DUF442 family)
MSTNHPITWVTEDLAVGPAPMSYATLDELRGQGVRAILNLCAEFTDLHRIEREHGFEVYHLPVEDEQAPDMEELEKALDWLDEAVYLGRKVYIHCRHGIGRTGTVLNAYILRRGLGHLRAWLTLRKLRAQPANFRQWRMVRRYGKEAVPLTVCTPTLEHRGRDRCGGGLAPFLADLDDLARRAEEACAGLPPGTGRCGRDHSDCCAEPFDLPLAEAVRLHSGLGAELGRESRQAVLERAADPSARSGPCPLLSAGRCQAWPLRPLRCILADLPPEERREALSRLAAEADKTSRELFQALTGRFMPEGFPRFTVADAITGRHVQAFFTCQKCPEAGPG